MAKATHSQEVLTGTSASYTEHEASDPTPPAAVAAEILRNRPTLGGAPSRDHGGASGRSTRNEHSSKPIPSVDRHLHALTTENPSPQTDEETSDVDSTDGNGLVTEPAPSAEPKKATPRKRTAQKATALKAAPVSEPEPEPEPESDEITDDDLDEFN